MRRNPSIIAEKEFADHDPVAASLEAMHSQGPRRQLGKVAGAVAFGVLIAFWKLTVLVVSSE